MAGFVTLECTYSVCACRILPRLGCLMSTGVLGRALSLGAHANPAFTGPARPEASG